MVLGVELEADGVVGWDVRQDGRVKDQLGAVSSSDGDCGEGSCGRACAVTASSC